MVSHYLDPRHYYSDVGRWGVQLFFVLSGFLIGGILLAAKDRIANRETSVTAECKNFYARRTLRIFPAFYLLIAVTFLLGNWSLAPFGWIALYAVNIWEVINCEVAGIFGHLYTLCIEEHFYLFFPLLVFLVPTTKVNWLFAGLIGLAVVYRLLIVDFYQLCNGTRLVFAELDSLAGGALVASLVRSGRLRPGAVLDRQLTYGALICGAVYFINFYVVLLTGEGFTSVAFTYFLFAVFACWLVYRAAFGFKGLAGSLLSWKPFVFLGTISYGIYLYHNFAGWFVVNATLRLGWSEPLPVAVAFTLQVFWTIAVASLSWLLVEQPCNRAKRYFEYKTEPAC
jgi:peptidoglycan/LPS O-acetylase OafA/YrhL